MKKISLKSTQTFWENEGSYFNGDFYLKTDFERIYNWLDSKYTNHVQRIL